MYTLLSKILNIKKRFCFCQQHHSLIGLGLSNPSIKSAHFEAYEGFEFLQKYFVEKSGIKTIIAQIFVQKFCRNSSCELRNLSYRKLATETKTSIGKYHIFQKDEFSVFWEIQYFPVQISHLVEIVRSSDFMKSLCMYRSLIMWSLNFLVLLNILTEAPTFYKKSKFWICRKIKHIKNAFSRRWWIFVELQPNYIKERVKNNLYFNFQDQGVTQHKNG